MFLWLTLNCSQQVLMWVIYFTEKQEVLCWQSFSECSDWGAEHHGCSVAEGAVHVRCGSLSQLADRPGPLGTAHQRPHPPLTTHPPIHQPDKPAKLLKGWTGGSQTALGSSYPWNKNSMLSVWLSLRLMSGRFINKREPGRLPPLPVSSV